MYCPNTRHEKLKGLCKTRWVERHTCLETFLELYEYTVACLNAICKPTSYPEVQEHAGDWNWDRESVFKAQGLVTSLEQFHNIVAFIILKNALDYIKSLASKLQRRDMEVYEAYKMVDDVVSEVENVRSHMDETYDAWYQEVKSLADRVGSSESRPRMARLQRTAEQHPGR